jgi:hypothetical protein
MTKDEAIIHLEAIRILISGPDGQPDSELYFALSEGIEALQRELDETSKEPAIDWKPFRQREMTEEEREEYPANIAAMWDEPTPDDEQIILITDGTIAWTDKFLIDDDGGCYLGSGVDIEEGMAWTPCPKLYKPKEASK